MLFHLPLRECLYSPNVFITSESWVCIVYVNTSTIQFKGNWKHLAQLLKTVFYKMLILLALYSYGKAMIKFILNFP